MVSIGYITYVLTYLINAVLSLVINNKIRQLKDEGSSILEDETAKNEILNMVYVKLGMIVIRMIFLSRMSLGGSIVSNSINVLTLFVLMNVTPAKTVQDIINIGLPADNALVLDMDGAIATLNEFDFWASVVGLTNAFIPLPGIVNWILILSILINTIVNGYDLPTPEIG